MEKPLVVERFADNGGHSHWDLVNVEDGNTLWTEGEPDNFCPDCGYPKFKKSFEDFERCHGCSWINKEK